MEARARRPGIEREREIAERIRRVRGPVVHRMRLEQRDAGGVNARRIDLGAVEFSASMPRAHLPASNQHFGKKTRTALMPSSMRCMGASVMVFKPSCSNTSSRLFPVPSSFACASCGTMCPA